MRNLQASKPPGSRLGVGLVLSNRGLWVTQNFSPWVYAGEPSNAVRIFSELEADEICFINPSGNLGRDTISTLKLISDQCFVPLTYGGGVCDLESARLVLAAGFEKIIIDRALWADSDVVRSISENVGASSVVASFSFLGEHPVHWNSRRPIPFDDLARAIEQVQTDGAGELKLTSISRNGTGVGADFDLITKIAPLVSIPIIYEGGVSSLDQVYELWARGVACVNSGRWLTVRDPYEAVLLTYPEFEEP